LSRPGNVEGRKSNSGISRPVLWLRSNKISRWKYGALARLPKLFEKGKNCQSYGQEPKTDDLMKIICELKLENDWYKKIEEPANKKIYMKN
jgi:hypothetical protein